MKRILYITPLVCGFEDILRGKKDSRGLPSFILPLQTLSNTYHIDIILISKFKEKLNISVEWISENNIIYNINNDLTCKSKIKSIYNKIKSLLQLSYSIYKALKNGNYNFVYCHGTAAFVGNMLACLYNVPCGYRLYGVVDIFNQIENNNKKAILYNLKYYMIFKMKKEFLLITDDGTSGDKVYDKWKPSKLKYKFYFMTNGLESAIDASNSHTYPQHPFIFSAARIDRLKRQDRVIKTLSILHQDKKFSNIHLYFAGHYDDDDSYYQELKLLVLKSGLEDYVHFLNALERNHMRHLAEKSIAILLLGDFSNRGNVFYEVASAGAIVIAMNDGSLEGYLVDGKSGFFVENENEAVNVIKHLMSMDDTQKNRIKNESKNVISKKMLSWNERVKKEISLIEECMK